MLNSINDSFAKKLINKSPPNSQKVLQLFL